MIASDFAVSEFGADPAKSASIAAKFNSINKAVGSRDQLRGVVVAKDNTPYFLIYSLGKGAFGETYAASRDGSGNTRYVVKMFKIDAGDKERLPEISLRHPHDYEFFAEVVEREYLISAVIRRRLGEEYCKIDIVCSIKRFYNTAFSRGYIVFPYVATATLTMNLFRVVHPMMLEYLDSASRSGLALQTFEQIKTMSHKRNTSGRIAAQLLNNVRVIQAECIDLARQLLMSVVRLHSVGIIHMDLKPDNIIVNNDTIRLIDFGLACVAQAEEDKEFAEREMFVLGLRDYLSTPMYEDPLAPIISDELPPDEGPRLDAYRKLEVYTVAKILQTIFDPNAIDSKNGEPRFPIVKATDFMIPGLFDLIVTMTGEGKGSSLPYKSLQPEEVERRRRLFESRPSVAEALRTFTELVLRWTEDGKE